MEPHGSPSAERLKEEVVANTTTMELHGSPSAARLKEAEVVAQTTTMGSHGSPSSEPLNEEVVVKSKKDEVEKEYFNRLMKKMDMEIEMDGEDGEDEEEYFAISKKMPRLTIVKYHDCLGKLWGWDKLLPQATSVSSAVYEKYLEEYHNHNVHKITLDTTQAECLRNEDQLVHELMHWLTREKEKSLMIQRSVILSCLIKERAQSVSPARCKESGAALLCIAKEAGLLSELLRRGANPIDDYSINQSTVIRCCALSLMNDNSVSVSAAMLGMAKEAEMMCMWMVKNEKHLGFFDPIPHDIRDRHKVRSKTLEFMVSIQKKSYAEHNTDKEELAFGSGSHGDSDTCTSSNISVVSKSRDEEDSKKTEREEGNEEENILEKLWGWERLVPSDSYVKSSYYDRYLEKYYKHNVNEFVAAAADMGAAVAKFCLKMEMELLQSLDDASTIIESSLILDHAFKICSTDTLPIVAFVCIKEEAELMCELLKQGAKPSDEIIQQSSMIRMCALGLVNLRGPQSIASAAVMMGMAKEAKIICDWMKRENKLLTSSLFQPREIHGSYLIRMNAFDLMTRMLQDHFFPSSKQNTARVAAPSRHSDAVLKETGSSQASVEATPVPKEPQPKINKPDGEDISNNPDAVPEGKDPIKEKSKAKQETGSSQVSVEDAVPKEPQPKINKPGGEDVSNNPDAVPEGKDLIKEKSKPKRQRKLRACSPVEDLPVRRQPKPSKTYSDAEWVLSSHKKRQGVCPECSSTRRGLAQAQAQVEQDLLWPRRVSS